MFLFVTSVLSCITYSWGVSFISLYISTFEIKTEFKKFAFDFFIFHFLFRILFCFVHLFISFFHFKFYKGCIWNPAKHLWWSIFARMVNEWKPLIIFAKISILYVLLDTKFASVFCFAYPFSTISPKPWFINPTLVKWLQRDSNPQPEILSADSL